MCRRENGHTTEQKHKLKRQTPVGGCFGQNEEGEQVDKDVTTFQQPVNGKNASPHIECKVTIVGQQIRMHIAETMNGDQHEQSDEQKPSKIFQFQPGQAAKVFQREHIRPTENSHKT